MNFNGFFCLILQAIDGLFLNKVTNLGVSLTSRSLRLAVCTTSFNIQKFSILPAKYLCLKHFIVQEMHKYIIRRYN